ncbi:hypothetical protein [Candidatus Electronema sp. PJ]|uniref:hypothetical protein n=1 Tax=Candidatus Electronema sp. PJ TaxID=3401572 RepID=UPI003AA83E83
MCTERAAIRKQRSGKIHLFYSLAKELYSAELLSKSAKLLSGQAELLSHRP